MCFIENGPQTIISIDSNGHLFIWKYEKTALTSKQVFEPAGKFRLDLKYLKFTRLEKGEIKIFPEGKENIDPAKPIKDAKIVEKINLFMS